MSSLFELNLSNIIFYIITNLWVLEFKFFPHKSNDRGQKGYNTFSLIMVTIIINIIFAIILNFLMVDVLKETSHQIIKYLGLFMYLTGLLIRYSAILTIGDHFTRNIEVEENKKLVSKGLYRWLCHPLYLGLLMLHS